MATTSNACDTCEKGETGYRLIPDTKLPFSDTSVERPSASLAQYKSNHISAAPRGHDFRDDKIVGYVKAHAILLLRVSHANARKLTGVTLILSRGCIR